MAEWIGGRNYIGRLNGQDGRCRGCGIEVGSCDCHWVACPVCGNQCWVSESGDYNCYEGCWYQSNGEY